MSHLLSSELPISTTTDPTANRILPSISNLMNHPPYNIDDLFTPNSSLTNVSTIINPDTTRSLIAGHEGLTTNINNTTHTLSPSSTVNNTLPTIDPLHGLLLGNTTAFDSVTIQQQQQHISPSLPQTTVAVNMSPNKRMNDLFQTKGNVEKEPSPLIIGDISQSPFDQDDKEVAESMSCSANYPLQFEALPNVEDTDTVFIPIKTNDDDGPINDTQHQIPSPTNYTKASLWSKSCHTADECSLKGIKAAARQTIDDFSDPTETSDKDDDSTADEDLIHSRLKRRTGRSPNSSQLPLNVDALHAIRELTHQLNEYQSNEHTILKAAHSVYDEKLERCCHRLEQLASKVDRMFNLEQPSILPRPSRPSPNSASLDILQTNEPQVTLTDAHYDRLEAMLIEKIQIYVQNAMKAVFEPYRDLKDNLHKELTAKLLAADTVIKQTITQIFRSKTMIDSLSKSVADAIKHAMITSYRDTFNQTVVPSFEKAATNMFQQTNEVFKRGTKEYLQEMTEYGRQQQRSLNQQREQMLTEIRKESAQLLKECEKANQELINTLKNEIIQYITKSLTPIIRETIQTLVRDEVNVTLRELFNAQKNEINTLIVQNIRQQQQSVTPKPQATVDRSTTPSITATTTVDNKQKTALILARSNQLNKAFEYVLSASDLKLVLYLCENVRPSDIFSVQPCPLQIPVILSLIQQLSADLTTHQEIKFNYLQEALICLDISNPNIRDYLYKVLIDLGKNLNTYIQTNPTSPVTKRFHLLYLASQSLVQKLLNESTISTK